MKYVIKSRFNERILCECETDSIAQAIEQAIKNSTDLSGANLSWANLSGADLYRANLSGANLSGANLSGANLSGANLSGANLLGANLSGANLSWANLSGANLSWANLLGANLSWANLSGADLSGANLSGANLSWANLSGANLSCANLSEANLYRANLSGAKINWQSHDTIAALLVREAGHDVSRRMVAGLILVSRDWCWRRFLAIEHDQREWALSALRQHVVDGDNAPEILRKAVNTK